MAQPARNDLGMGTAVNMPMDAFRLHRHEVEGSMAYAPLGGDAFRNGAYFSRGTAQKKRFQAMIMVQVDMHCGDHQIVGIVLQLSQPLREPPFVVVVDVGQAGNAERGLFSGQAMAFQFPAQHVAYRFGTVRIAAGLDQRVEFMRKRFVQRDGKAFHGGLVDGGLA